MRPEQINQGPPSQGVKVVGDATTTFLQKPKESQSYNDIWLCDPRVTTHFILLFIGLLGILGRYSRFPRYFRYSRYSRQVF